ncbi:mechanosensitive ion channel family protein [Emcibacter sp. SYSU 3D8]
MEPFWEFWIIVQDVWNRGLLGATIGQLVISVGIITLALVFRHLFARIVIGNLRMLAKRTSGTFDDLMVDAIAPPVRLVPVILGIYLAFRMLELAPEYWDVVLQLVRSMVAFCIFWAFFRLITPLSQIFEKLAGMLGEATLSWLVKAVKGIIAFLGGAVILQMWGIEVGPLLAGLGLFGVAVALGAQDLFKNLIAGVLILVEKRFAPGEWIQVDGVVEGTVESIGFRSTFIRRFDKAPVFVPNAKLSDNAVTNFTRMTHRRIYWKIGVEYGTTVDQLRQICSEIETYLAASEDFAGSDEVSTFVNVDSFNDSSIDIMLYCFTKTTSWGEWLKIKEELAYKVKHVVEEAGTGFAFPSQSLYLEKVPFDMPEAFNPPGEKSDADQAGRKAA